ncbi:histidine kinase/DNA gyrase B/HSP90-like ATPase [Pacificibacter maritimus]|uniref:histidine kinase n=1 Tax=Pacificibacter maritimus TaxID=762213 RepID=A0A3N4UN36_9RHOB|nr:ATP-binding protein [Pacificibacter maritimus]RPE66457.1 histidine kinase/DNA gyrase B/HSP90-like ATPase [Pacificibacter maritimus]
MLSEARKLTFQPRAKIIRTIGDQLISGPEAAIIELVKNSYDADASYVSVKFFPPLDEGECRIEVSDDGHGMTLDDIRQKWMEPATASKAKQRLTRSKNRKVMGSKGIGRFASAKLGDIMSLVSTAEDDGRLQTILIPELDWSIFTDDVYLHDIEIDYISQPAFDNTGTLIEIRNAKQTWNEARLKQLHLELRKLVSPREFLDDKDPDFKIFLDLSLCTKSTCGFAGDQIVTASDDQKPDDKHRVLAFPVLTACDYELIGSFDKVGKFEGTFQIKRAGRAPETISIEAPKSDEVLSPGAFHVQISIFDREPETIKKNMEAAGMSKTTAAEAKKMLDSIAGVSIFRNGFRIRPYGDSQNDWLTLDSRRVQNPSMKIGRNQISGIISVGDQHDTDLLERSSREGFEDNAAFQRLTALVLLLLDQFAEPKRYAFRSDTGIARKRDVTFDETRELAELAKIRKLVSTLEPKERAQAEHVISEQSAKLQDRIDQLQERHRILEATSSLGAIVGEVLHEGSPAARYIAEASDQLLLRYKSLLEGKGPGFEASKKAFSRKLPFIKDYGFKLNSLFVNLEPLAGGKRGKPQFFYPGRTIDSARELFASHNIPIETISETTNLELLGYPSDLSTAVLNIIGNSIYWLTEHKIPMPCVKVKISRDGDNAIILIEDNGPGVPAEFAEQIFEVGFSLKNGGTGLGLNIARETLARSGAKLFFHEGFVGGTQFEIRFPAKKIST